MNKIEQEQKEEEFEEKIGNNYQNINCLDAEFSKMKDLIFQQKMQPKHLIDSRC